MSDELRTVEEQVARVLAEVAPTAAESVPLAQAQGRTLQSEVRAAVDIPVFDNSAMDGFAVRYADVAAADPQHPVTLRVVADLPAGTALDPVLQAGEAARIMTGSPVPTSADTIVPFEDTVGGLADSLTDVIVRHAPQATGVHLRRRAADASVGDVIVAAGTALGPLQLSAAAASGVAVVSVHARPRVAVISTGSELVAAGEPLGRGQIPESNGLLLAALATDAGAEIAWRTSVDDTDAAFLEALRRAAEARADIVITSGGVSAGAFEVVKNVLQGSDVAFSKVAMQPGKPQAFGRLPTGALLFGLPGNPVSSAVSFEVFVRPALLRMQGRSEIYRPILRLPAASGWRTPPSRRQYLPAAIDRSDPARWTVRPATGGGSGSHLAGGLARAEAYAIVAAEIDAVAEGDLVDVMLMA
ncbi:molybdopterin molybdotransferase MoeA [Microbacterium sp. cx-55]|uniref:molybdopterin molybdotransferase MoeA n=1 Tax=Microbacterium sp. cx-55 TaxID=2875948 RepID=UPI001CBC9980|nr:gephyrin-like molybdotransferase Glp [Microbacterium sp. cx-55]MBZ4487957.1 molybdopterin molybdotransferase MoeA [Microbacterium sp. cx-55]UGB34633.1 molybdopterin molybdotransferase MoeA [Microbacterium sp. cx-55]